MNYGGDTVVIGDTKNICPLGPGTSMSFWELVYARGRTGIIPAAATELFISPDAFYYYLLITSPYEFIYLIDF